MHVKKALESGLLRHLPFYIRGDSVRPTTVREGTVATTCFSRGPFKIRGIPESNHKLILELQSYKGNLFQVRSK